MKMRMTNTARILSATLLGLAFASTQAQAQSTVYLSSDASQCDIFKGLSRTLPKECQAKPAASPRMRGLTVRTRGIVFLPDPRQADAPQAQDQTQVASAAQDAPATDTANKELSVSFRAEFEWNSARLTPSAKQVIDRVAQVLSHELMSDKVFQIEGHADSSGADEYNMVLSEKRARAVQNYLVSDHGISASRLQYVGKGETEPFDPQNPASGVNRRVEFKNITG